MKLIALYQPYPHGLDGLQRVVIDLAQKLPSYGFETLIIVPQEGVFTQALAKAKLAYLVSDPGELWNTYGRGGNGLSYAGSPRRLFALANYWRRLAGDLRKARISLMHCNDYRGVMLAAPAARLAGVPVIWHMHGFIPSRWANVIAAALVDWTVPVSRGMLDYLKIPLRLLGRCRVIYNGVDGGGMQTAETGKIPLVLAVGVLHPRKGYENLIQAFTEVRKAIPDAECWIIGGEFGEGSYAESLRALARQTGLEKAVRFIGFTSDVPQYMARCRLLAIASHVEAFGMVAIEAMAAAKPVVAARTGGLADIILDGETGFLVEPGNTKLMGERIIEVLRNADRADQMGRAGRRRVLEEFSTGKMIEQFANLYGGLLSCGASASR